MEKQVIKCDLCRGQMYAGSRSSGNSLHLKEKSPVKISSFWWWQREKQSISTNMDICTNCYSFIQSMLGDDGENKGNL